ICSIAQIANVNTEIHVRGLQEFSEMATENCNFPSTLDMNELPIVQIKLNTPPLKCIVKGTYSHNS
ncbi:ester hydrolase, partial [Aphis craccivora]